MIRFNIVRNLLVVSALVMGGCAAQTSSSSDGQSDHELRHTELVAVDGKGGSGLAPNVERNVGGPAPVGNEANGPQPEPWNGIDDPNGSPQPEPWRPKKVAPEPDPASSSAAPPKP